MGTAVRAAWIVAVMSACGKGGDKAPAPVAETGAENAAVNAAVVVDAAPAKIDPLAVVAVTEVPAGPLDPPPEGPLVTAAMLQLSFEGAPMARVMGGKIDPGAIDPATGRIAPLASFLDSWVKTAPATRVVKLAVAPDLPARIVVDVMRTFQAIPQRDFALIVRNADGPGALPLRVPETGAAADPVGMALTFTSDRVLLWSLTGVEGSLRAPKLVVPRGEPSSWERVRETLGEIGARRAPARQIVVMIDEAVKTSELVAAMQAVRPAFPDVVLSSGFGAVADGNDEDEAQAFADLLTGGSDDVAQGDMSRRLPGADLNAQLAEITADGAAVGVGSGNRGTRDDTPPGDAPTGRITVKRKEAFDLTSLTSDAVAMKIQSAYFSGLKRCYKQALKADPVLRGDLALALRVNEMGRAVDIKVTSPSDDLDDCVAGLAASWRFAVPKDDDGEATDAGFQLRFGLVPE